MIKFVCISIISALVVAQVDCAPDVYWREYIDGVIPQDAIAAEPAVYIGQMPVNGILPGTIYSGRKAVVSEYFAKKAEATEALKILCSNHQEKLKWEYVNIGSLAGANLNNLVRGGFEEGQILYIGKTFHEGQWKVGKVFPAGHKWDGLRIWWNGGGSHAVHDFQVLKSI